MRQRNVALIACVLQACDPETYIDAHDRPKWENAIIEEYNSLLTKESY